MSEPYDPSKILADVRSHLADASNRLQDLDLEWSANSATKDRAFITTDKAIDLALHAVDAMTEDPPA